MLDDLDADAFDQFLNDNDLDADDPWAIWFFCLPSA